MEYYNRKRTGEEDGFDKSNPYGRIRNNLMDSCLRRNDRKERAIHESPLREENGHCTQCPYKGGLFFGFEDVLAAGGFDGFDGACGGGNIDLEGFGELACSNDLEATFGFFFADFEGNNEETGINDGFIFEFTQTIEVYCYRLKIDDLETVLTFDERSTAN